METLVARCPANMPEATLSAWYDHELSADLDGRVQSHVANCRACQAYLDDFEATRRTLRQDRPPEMQAAIWGDVRGRIDPAKPGTARVPSRRPLIAGGLAAAGAIALLFAVILAFTTHGATSVPTSSTSSTLSATATGTHHATPTHTASPTATPGAVLAVTQNWQTAKGVPNGENVAFSSAMPRTGYACSFTNGPPSNKVPNATMRLYATQDGGVTWQAASGQVAGGQCGIVINPTNPSDVVMQMSNCNADELCNGSLPYAYRTLDGGQTWSQLSMPPGAEDGYSNVGDPTYVGNALFVSASTGADSTQFQPSRKHQLAVSINDQPFTWIDLTTVTSANFSIHYAFGGGFYIVDGNVVKKTMDGGQTWTAFTPQGISAAKLLDQTSVITTQNAVFCDINQSVFMSVDGGQTWTPDGPWLSVGGQFMTVTPDGTFYVRGFDENLYRRASGSTTWQLFYPFSATFRNLLTVSWDANGHPAALWASLVIVPSGMPNSPAAYLQYRAP